MPVCSAMKADAWGLAGALAVLGADEIAGLQLHRGKQGVADPA